MWLSVAHIRLGRTEAQRRTAGMAEREREGTGLGRVARVAPRECGMSLAHWRGGNICIDLDCYISCHTRGTKNSRLGAKKLLMY